MRIEDNRKGKPVETLKVGDVFEWLRHEGEYRLVIVNSANDRFFAVDFGYDEITYSASTLEELTEYYSEGGFELVNAKVVFEG